MFVTGHYDGHQVQLDEPVNLKPNTKVRVEIPDETDEDFRRDWNRLSRKAFAKSYEREEREFGPEPEYLIRKPNLRKSR